VTTESGKFPPNDPMPLGVHIKQARARVFELIARDQRTAQEKEYRQALQWLAENRQKYAGQWIALRGAQLLAAGLKAAEVFGRVRGQRPPALVMKVELQDLPFAGW
jgi:hypothetical protein